MAMISASRIKPRRRKPSLRWKLRAIARNFAFRHEEAFNTLTRIRRKATEAAIWLLCVGGLVGAGWVFLILLDRLINNPEWW